MLVVQQIIKLCSSSISDTPNIENRMLTTTGLSTDGSRRCDLVVGGEARSLLTDRREGEELQPGPGVCRTGQGRDTNFFDTFMSSFFFDETQEE